LCLFVPSLAFEGQLDPHGPRRLGLGLRASAVPHEVTWSGGGGHPSPSDPPESHVFVVVSIYIIFYHEQRFLTCLVLVRFSSAHISPKCWIPKLPEGQEVKPPRAERRGAERRGGEERSREERSREEMSREDGRLWFHIERLKTLSL